MKVVINICYGGFGLSDEAVEKYKTLKGITEYIYHDDIERNDPDLVRIVEEMGEEADGTFARLKVVEIPDNIDFTIEEYDGCEWVAETHRTWS